MNEDYKELLLAFSRQSVSYIVVGAYAMGCHGYSRATGDLDLWVKPSVENSKRVYESLREFGASLSELSPATFEKEGIVFQIGVAPRRVDLLTRLDGLAFDPSGARCLHLSVEGFDLPVLSLDDLIKNKESTGREKDRLDAKVLRTIGKGS